MDAEVRGNFADIIALAQATFEQVEYVTDFTPSRAILRLQAKYRAHTILVTELLGTGVRKYRYYILRGEWIEAGFDNAPDPRAIKLKYGQIGQEHTGENVPHLHLNNKMHLSLTEDMTFQSFIDWIKANI